ncbi:ATP-dependent DNA helicase MER3 [Pyrenophora tritici-repentis Pt-1C-BFP]|uniref:DNA 3'-5' helicase n=1 Tax=Pyrenophora tritici-repentis (strain Pt-1C-BFP) TaxID=426418 RepID=B2VW28_PYRTR|nr:ATP-dependent DNA helicase MER3 [Pyrenophora tritici-repentis Pt-1C-BFP]EDU40828.1 ATP-dependent DNA helicase MER3 [Pyrenophora tritici-repentis Pt-1C-BFP]
MVDQHHLPDASRRASRYDILQPQFKQPARPVAQRDRYRATQYCNPIYDVVENDNASDKGLQLDSFDERLLQEPYPDRQQQAMQGRARLSLAPAQSTFFNHAAPTQSQTSYSARENDMYHDPGRFAYNPTQTQHSSSDVLVAPSSSPAFKASQRHVEKQQEQHMRSYQQVTPFKPLRDDPQSQIPSINQMEDTTHPYGQQTRSRPERNSTSLTNLPMCQDIRLLPVITLPDRLRTVFPYPTFNAVQSKCFERMFQTDDNFVLASPTGSGKTVILELAICRAIATNATNQYKVVYQAPTKALCAERQRDWEAKFTKLGLKCAELTGDTDVSDLQSVQSANIIITTPEKWDSMTRKWKDHEKLMRLIKVFLIDEVHILREDRGATLEAVVSRMKSIGTNVRFVALSATVPNFQDIAAWLGKNSLEPDIPAANESFSEEFRPVKLKKHVCGYAYTGINDFGFEKVLDGKLPEVIATYSERKPIMVFCATRASTINTATLIANWWASKAGQGRFWNRPSKTLPLHNKELRDTVASGVAFHHAGLDLDDRMQVERGFIAGEINVICCTSTLAVGVNLPCHLVIIKNTMVWGGGRLQEYSDLEMMQMLGRAGRPQFDDTAVAVIMTRQTKARRYDMLVTGQQLIESKLHLNLVDHLNAEIGLGTIQDPLSARKWLRGTFLFVRLQKNPGYYKLEGARSGQSIEEQVDDICSRDITLLQEINLVSGQEDFKCTEFGHAMARYYVHYETMKIFMGLHSRCSLSEILSAIAQATEYSSIRFRQGEKALYKLLNKSPSIRWPIPVNLDLPAQKVSLIVQSVLGSADISFDGEMSKHKAQYTMEVMVVFKTLGSLIRCIIDCQIALGDSVSIHNALMLERSIGARAWDDSPLQMKQVHTIGVVAVRKLVNAGIKCIEDLEDCEAHRIEALLGKNPPYGLKVLENVRTFPKLRVSLHARPSTTAPTPRGVKIEIRADIGFINEQPPQRFNSKLIYVCLLLETSDGRKIHFARISASKLDSGQSVAIPALLVSPDQSVNCYVMCDSIAGSMRVATVKPRVNPSMFPKPGSLDPDTTTHQSNMSKRRIDTTQAMRKPSVTSEDFGDDDLDDETLVKAAANDLDFDHIENYANPFDAMTRKNTATNKQHKNTQGGKGLLRSVEADGEDNEQEPVQLANGKWACNHACKDKGTCKHFCCKNGMEKPPKKKSVTKRVPSGETRLQPQQKTLLSKGKERQTKLQITTSKRKISSPIEELDLTQQEKKKKTDYEKNGPREYRDLHQLHKTIQGNDLPSSLHSVMHKKPAYCYSVGGEHNLAFMNDTTTGRLHTPSDYGSIQFEDSPPHPGPSHHLLVQQDSDQLGGETAQSDYLGYEAAVSVVSRGSDTYGDDDSLLGDAMIGLVDSHTLQGAEQNDVDQSQEEAPNYADEVEHDEYGAGLYDDFTEYGKDLYNSPQGVRYVAENAPPTRTFTRKLPSLFVNSMSTSATAHENSEPADTMYQDPELSDLAPQKAVPSPSQVSLDNHLALFEEEDIDDLDMVACEPKEDVPAKDTTVPEAFGDLEPWLFQEFGDIVELIEE